MSSTSRAISLALALFTPAAVSAEYLSRTYRVPVVARNGGVAGSTWRTELCLSNPHSSQLKITLHLHQAGEYTERTIKLDPLETVCSQDFISEWFGFSEFQGGLSSWASSSLNPDLDMPYYPISVRVYNVTDEGTYGLAVTPVPAINLADETQPGYLATGIHNYGTPGVDGFRTSIGLFNDSKNTQQVEMLVFDESGNPVWQRTEWIAGQTQVQYLLPSHIVLTNGVAAFINHGGSLGGTTFTIYPYATVTENETGDGRFIGAGQSWIGTLIKVQSGATSPS